MGALDELIANPRKPVQPPAGAAVSRSKGQKGPQDVKALVAALRAPQRPTGGNGGKLPPVDLSVLQGKQPDPMKIGHDGLLDSIGSTIGDGLKKVISVADAGRGYGVSGLKELGDFVDSFTDKGKGAWYTGENNQASWKDFLDQGKRHMGFGEIVANSGLASDKDGKPSNSDRLLGFIGDVAADPLTYVGAGVGTKAAKGAEMGLEALSHAVETGARKGIASELVRAGASDGLIAAAAERGRGALTKAGMKAAGATAEDVAKFGGMIDGIGVGLHGGRKLIIPGTEGLAAAIEGAKGGLKQTLGRSAAAKTLRALRVTSSQGEREFLDVIRSSSHSIEQKAVAARSLSIVQEARGLPAKFVKTAELSLRKNLGEDLKRLSEQDSRSLVDALEGVGDPSELSAKVRSWFDGMRDKLGEAGVPVEYRQNYVPHRVTPEFRALASDNEGVRQWVESLSKTEALQGQRKLVAGVDKFLGVDLVNGSIREINDIAKAKFGVKALEDDARALIGDYMAEAGHAYGRHVTAQKLVEAGVGKPIVEKLVGEAASAEELAKVAKRFASSESKRAEIIDKAIATRQGALKKSRNLLDAHTADVKTKIDEVTRQLTENASKVEAAKATAERLTAELEHQQSVVAEWKKVAGSARRTERKALNRKIAQAEAKIVELKSTIDAAAEAAGTSSVKAAQLDAALQKQVAAFRSASAAKQDLEAQLASVSGPLGTPSSPLAQEARLAREQQKATTAALRLQRGKTALDAAAQGAALQLVPLQTLTDSLEKELAKLTSARNLTKNLPSAGKRVASKEAARDLLRERTSTVMAVLRDVSDPAVETIARIEAQASIYDMRAWRQATVSQSLKAMQTAMESPEFRTHFAQVIEDGFKEIAGKVQIPEWVDDAMTLTHQLKDPKWWDGALKYYRKFLGWQKAWMVASPGFVTRNATGGIFNMYLDGVSAESGRVFFKFYRMFTKNPDNYMEEAVRVFGQETAQRLDDALTAAGATGWGLVPQEVATSLADHKASWNPLKTDNKITRPVAHASEELEAWMRGTHAFDVISRGGSIDEAAARVNKFHFNYRDITDFDRNAKLVVPFWTFYSRNIGLQAEVWATMPQKLNRTYFNLKRNLEYGTEEETTPQWMVDAGAIRTPWKTGGNTLFFQPDIPSLRFAQDMTGVGSANEIVSNMSPVPKLILEMQAGRKSFNDAPFKDSYSTKTYDQFGNPQAGPREAPGWSQLPFVKQALQATGAMQTYADGTPVMTDRTQYLLEGLAPPLARVNALFPNQADKERLQGTSWASFMGAGVRQNTPQMQESELWRRRNALAKIRQEEQDLGYAG